MSNIIKIKDVYNEISNLILDKKHEVHINLNNSIISLYWNIGKCLVINILNSQRADYGKELVNDISLRLATEYGKGFNRASVF